MHIVLVDDDPLVLHALGSLFRRKGHAVSTYGSPLDCPIYKSTSCPCIPEAKCPDIIISDVDMPDVTGLTFVEAVFNRKCKCKHVALLSGKDISDHDMKRIAKLGTRVFTKPLDFAEFEAWVMLRERSFN
jgi:DNA-binding response OmpR family regulator